MPRIQLVELEDLAWWPKVVRDLATGYFHFMESRFELHAPVIAALAEALRACGTRRGFRTIFNAFHHFRPTMALAVLCDARAAGQPIGVFEIPERALTTTIPLLFTPVFVWVATPFIRPFRWRRLLWTYVIPLVPLTCWWDGLVSQLRAYEPSELTDLAAQVPEGFTWRAGRVPIGRTPGHLTYLIGLPTSATQQGVAADTRGQLR